MALLPLKFFPDPVLRSPTELVTDYNSDLNKFLDSLAETMYEEGGVGLAAPQVGILKRVSVIDVSPKGSERLEFINPKIVSREGSVSSEEGCLSIPGYREKIKRSDKVVVKAFNRKGELFEITTDGILAICLQHEIDHLDGILFIDHLSRLKRSLFKQWLKKQQ